MAVPTLTMAHAAKLDFIVKFRTLADESVHPTSQQRVCSKESLPLERVTIGEEGIVEQPQRRQTTKLLEFVRVLNKPVNLSCFLYNPCSRN